MSKNNKKIQKNISEMLQSFHHPEIDGYDYQTYINDLNQYILSRLTKGAKEYGNDVPITKKECNLKNRDNGHEAREELLDTLIYLDAYIQGIPGIGDHKLNNIQYNITYWTLKFHEYIEQRRIDVQNSKKNVSKK